MNGSGRDIDPNLDVADEADEAEEVTLEQVALSEDAPEPGTLANGRAVIAAAVKVAPAGPGVYRMIDIGGEVLYVGKARSIAKRIASYTRPAGLVTRIARMVAATARMEFITTRSEIEALLLESNLIKKLRPRFNVLLRDDKSFPYILITGDHAAPQIVKYRGARNRKGRYFGPFASGGAVNRTLTALQRAFLLRTCTDAVYESRTRPCLLFQIKRCAGPCTGEISLADYAGLVSEAADFLSGRSSRVREAIAHDMEQAAEALEFERAAVFRDRLAALAAVQAQQGVNPRGIEEADVFAIHQEGGFSCVEVFFFRTGQNWGNRAYFPRADRSLEPGEVLGPFIGQFYDDKPPPRQVLISHEIEEQALLGEALSERAGHKVEIISPKRGEKRELIEQVAQNAREALGRKIAETSSQARLLAGVAEAFGLTTVPRRIEVYDNSHIMGTNAVGGMIVAGPEGFLKGEYRKFNIRSTEITPGDDFGMMREVLERRFGRLMREASDAQGQQQETPVWPDLLLIDGGAGQLRAVRETLEALGVTGVALVGIAKGVDRDAGRERFFVDGREPFMLPARDPVLFFVQRLRDEAHRFAIGAHRAKRAKAMTSTGLDDIPGIGPSRKRALMRAFGTVKAISSASIADLAKVEGISAQLAKAIYDTFNDGGG